MSAQTSTTSPTMRFTGVRPPSSSGHTVSMMTRPSPLGARPRARTFGAAARKAERMRTSPGARVTVAPGANATCAASGVVSLKLPNAPPVWLRSSAASTACGASLRLAMIRTA
jgi:hypothetical protein